MTPSRTAVGMKRWGWRTIILALAAVVIAPVGAHATLPDTITPIMDAPLESYERGRPPNKCNSTRPGVRDFQRLLQQAYPGRNSHTARACPGTVTNRTSYHPRGLALDFMLDVDKSSNRRIAREIFEWLFEPSSDGTEKHVRLRRLGIAEVIWDNKIWLSRTASYGSQSANATADWSTWENYSDYRRCSSNDRNCRHENHIHFSFTHAGGNKQTSWWSNVMAPYRDAPGQPLKTMNPPAFEVDAPLTRGDFGLWLYRAAGVPMQAGDFDPPGHERAWEWHDDHGVSAVGSDANLNEALSRAQFAQILHEFDGLDQTWLEVDPQLAELELADVNESESEIYWLARTGSVDNLRTEGESGTFYDPDQTITRGDAMVYLYRWAGQPGYPNPIRHVYAELIGLDTHDPAQRYYHPLMWGWYGGIASNPFGDVPLSHPFFSEVGWLVDTGATEGYGLAWWDAANEYRPTSGVSRMAMAAFLYRLSGADYQPDWWQQTFHDVNRNHTFYREIEWLATTGITDGYSDGSFRPSANVSRQAMAAFLHRLAGEPPLPGGGVSFSDVPADHPFFGEIDWLADTGVTTGYNDGSFGATSTVSRQAMAAFLYRLYALLESVDEGGQDGSPEVHSPSEGDGPGPSPEPSGEPSPSPSPAPSPEPSPSPQPVP